MHPIALHHIVFSLHCPHPHLLLAICMKPNARRQLLPEAEAERTLEAVSWTPLLGASAAVPPHISKEQGQPIRFLLSSRAHRGLS
jgi:hypothetical protein